MSRNRKAIYTALGILALVVIGVEIWLSQANARPAPSTGYYVGPMMNKQGTHYSDERGNVVPPPPGNLPGKAEGAPIAPPSLPGYPASGIGADANRIKE